MFKPDATKARMDEMDKIDAKIAAEKAEKAA
jgi:hypothetical protein